MEIRPIRTEADHAWALGEIERLWEKAEPGTPEGDRFEILSTLIEAYEREHFPMPPPDPIEALRFFMDQRGLKQRDLLPVFKTTARVSEVLGRTRRLNITMIRRLHEQFSIPLECLISSYKLKSKQPRRSVKAAKSRF